MSRQNTKKKVRVLPLLLAFQMFCPINNVALAQMSGDEGQTDAQRVRGTMETMASVLQGANQMGQQFVQMRQQQMRQQQAQQLMMQMQQTMGIRPVDPTQVPPIISQNGCFVLPARTDQLSSGLTCEGQLNQELYYAGHYDALIGVAEQNANTLKNFLTEGHERFTTQGMGCYAKARNQLETQLKAREELLKQMKVSLERMIENFKAGAQADLDKVKKGDILLNGAKSSLKGEDKAKYTEALKDFKFEEKFNDPQCQSLLSDTAFAGAGSGGGFRGIEELLSKEKDKVKPENFFAKKSSYEKEIRRIATEASRLAAKEDQITDAAKVLSGIRTREFSTGAEALKQSFNVAIARVTEQRRDLQEDLMKTLGEEEDLAPLIQQIQSESVNINQTLSQWEKQQKNVCMAQHIQREFGGIEGFVGRLEDPNISEKANDEADSAFKNYVSQILADDRFTVEEKMQKIEQVQQQRGNSRYGFTSGRSFTVQGRQVGASTRLRASDMVSLLARDCMAAFDQDERGNGFSARDKVNALRTYASAYSRSKQEFANDVQTEIFEGMIDCPDKTEQGAGTCNSANKPTDINGPGFCIRTASACASNFLGCHQKAQGIVETTRAEQQSAANRYRANLDGLKQNLYAEFETIKAQLEQSSAAIDGLFQMGTMYEKEDRGANSGLELNLTQTELLEGVDPSLALEDPDKYREKIVQNIDQTKAQLAKHRTDVMKAYDEQINTYKENYTEQLAEWEGIKTDCASGIAQLEQGIKRENERLAKEAQEQNDRISEVCSQFDQFRTNPCPTDGNSEAGDLLGNMADINSVMGGADAQQAANQIRQTVAQCNQFNSDASAGRFSNPGGNGTSSSNPALNVSLDEFCSESGRGGEEYECIRYRAQFPSRFLASSDSDDEDESTTAQATGECSNNQIDEALNELRETEKICKNDSNDSLDLIAKESSCPNGSREITSRVAILALSAGRDMLNGVLTSTCTISSNTSDDEETPRSGEAQVVADARELLNQYRRSVVNQTVGQQVSLPACEAGNNGNPGGEIMDMMNQGMRGLAGQQGPTAIGM